MLVFTVQADATVKLVWPVNIEGAIFPDDIDKVEVVLFPNVFDSKVVNANTKVDGPRLVFTEAQCVIFVSVIITDKVSCLLVIFNLSRLGEAKHPFSCIHIYEFILN